MTRFCLWPASVRPGCLWPASARPGRGRRPRLQKPPGRRKASAPATRPPPG